MRCSSKVRVLCPTGSRFISAVSGDSGSKLGRIATFDGLTIPPKPAGNMKGGIRHNAFSWSDDFESSSLALRLARKSFSPGPSPTETSNDTEGIAPKQLVPSLSYRPSNVNMGTRKIDKFNGALDMALSSQPSGTSAHPKNTGNGPRFKDVLSSQSSQNDSSRLMNLNDSPKFQDLLSSRPGSDDRSRSRTSNRSPKFKNTARSQPGTNDSTRSRTFRNSPLTQRVSSSSQPRQSSIRRRNQPEQAQALDKGEDNEDELDFPPVETGFLPTDLDQLFLLKSKEYPDNFTPPPPSLPGSQSIPKRVQHAMECYGGDYSRILPEAVVSHKLEPLRHAQATLGRRRDVSTKRRERTLDIVERMVVKEVRA